MKKLNRVMPWAVVCFGFALVIGCGDPGPVGQEAINPPAEEAHEHEEGADASHEHTDSENGDEG